MNCASCGSVMMLGATSCPCGYQDKRFLHSMELTYCTLKPSNILEHLLAHPIVLDLHQSGEGTAYLRRARCSRVLLKSAKLG